MVRSAITGAKSLHPPIVWRSNNTSTVYNGMLVDGGTSSLSLTKVGSGMLTLGGSDGYSGATKVLGGTLQVGDVSAIPYGPGFGDVTIASSGQVCSTWPVMGPTLTACGAAARWTTPSAAVCSWSEITATATTFSGFDPKQRLRRRSAGT